MWQWGFFQLLFTVIIMVINQKFFYQRLSEHPAPGAQHGRSGGTGIRRVFLYSTYALFAMTDAQMRGDAAAVMSYMHEFILNLPP